MGVVLLLLAACLPLQGRTARLEPRLEPDVAEPEEPRLAAKPRSSWLEKYKEEARRRLKNEALVSFPHQLTVDYRVDQYLGAGGFGESWLVTVRDPASAMYNQQVVVKLLYVVDEHEVPKHLTWRLAMQDSWSHQGAREAARECEVASELHEQGQRSGVSGVERVMNCFGHNIPDVAADVRARLDTPLFLVLQNCGAEDLTKFMHRKAGEDKLSVELVSDLFKQVLQGLDFLASLSEPWVHHDLKPDNVVVKSHKDGSHSAYLIDLGATVKATAGFMCKFTACTSCYAPSEWGLYNGETCPQLNFDWSAECPSCSTSFDMFAAAAILFEMVIGSRLYDLKNAWDDNAEELVYAAVDVYAKHPATIDTAHVVPGGVDEGATYKTYVNLMAAFLETGSKSEAFFDATMAGLRSESRRRPTAAALLKHEFFALEPTVVKPAPVLPMTTHVGGTCRFKVGEVVEAYHFANDLYVPGTVTALSSTGFMVTVDVVEMVQVKGAAPGTRAPLTTKYTRPCLSSLFRKITTQPAQQQQLPQEPSLPTGGYRPAVGKRMKNFDAVTRSTDSSCPSLCTQCDTYPKLGPRQFVCWSPTRLISAAAAKWLYNNNCNNVDTYSMKKFGRSFFGYVCAK